MNDIKGLIHTYRNSSTGRLVNREKKLKLFSVLS